ncbi:MAG TPA: prepilin-type N-terminal cleavage/methylation domain-containing protein [Burkholderiaceae bacterium]|nr:prepilin-type N-terminal cleavage/methylation domain-containing protein [Burkholderiaceae bacterium]
MKQQPHSPHPQGFALLEVLVSILILSFGILGIVGLQARAINFSVDAEDRNRAALLANEAATDMWVYRSLTIRPDLLAAWTAKVADPTAGGLPGGKGIVSPVAGSSNSVDILITWKEPGHASEAGNAGSRFSTRVILP